MDTIVVDNWYENPDEIREMALSNFKEKDMVGGKSYPGNRTFTSIDNLVENFEKFEKFLGKKINPSRWIYKTASNFTNNVSEFQFNFDDNKLYLKETKFSLCFDQDNSNGAFQYLTQNDIPWVHSDVYTTIAAAIYLTPNAPSHSGTGIYKNKQTGIVYENAQLEQDMGDSFYIQDNWDIIEKTENFYNRCVIWNSKKYHRAVDTFGTDVNNSRLTQVFFFDLE